MRWYCGPLLMFCMITPALAQQDDTVRVRAAVPALMQQRNAAMDAAALCEGDSSLLKARIAELEKQLAAAKPDGPPK